MHEVSRYLTIGLRVWVWGFVITDLYYLCAKFDTKFDFEWPQIICMINTEQQHFFIICASNIGVQILRDVGLSAHKYSK